jgi:hypothetical protein
LAGLLLAGAGCLNTDSSSPVVYSPGFSPFEGPTGPDVVQLMVAIVEQPLGDSYLNHELWELVDEQQFDFETKGKLADNGLRAGVLGGTPPARLQRLITSERCCEPPRRIRMREDGKNTVARGTVRDDFKLTLQHGEETIPLEREKGSVELEVTPTIKDEQHITLRFTPVIKHGDPEMRPRPLREPSGVLRWDLRIDQPAEPVDWLSWEMTVAANDYILVAPLLESEDSLGRSCFLDLPREKVGRATQRLLILRAIHARDEMTIPGEMKDLPVAVQAGLGVISP